ncbi:MAG: AI-2E family transporter [Clostridia bacterium]|nr:AI-2E family transporter [Clostridia bacterium]
MKLDWNRKYTTIAAYAVITGFLLLLLVFAFIHFDSVSSAFAIMNDVLTPVYLGIIFAYLMNPILKMCEKHIFRFKVTSRRTRNVKRFLSITLTIIIVLIILTILFLLIIPQVYLSITDLISKMGGYIKDTIAWLDTYLPDSVFSEVGKTLDSFYRKMQEGLFSSSISDELQDISDQLDTIASSLEALITNSYAIIKDWLPQIFGAFAGFVGGFLDVLIGIFFAIYFLASKERLTAQIKKLLRAVTSSKTYNSILELAIFTDKTFGGFITGKIIDSTIIGILCFIVCAIFQMPYAILVSVFVGIMNVIPVVGPFIGAIPGVFIIFIVDPTKALIFIIINIVLQQIDGNVIGPKILGQTTGLSAVWVLFSITVMGGLWGLFGMLIAVPIFAVLYSLLKIFAEKKLSTRNLPTATLDYYSGVEDRTILADEENEHYFAMKIKSMSEGISKQSFGDKLKNLSKRKKKSDESDSDNQN